MKYIFNEDNTKSVTEKILQINNVTYDDLDISNFIVDYNLDIVKAFIDKLLSNKDKRFFIVGDYDCDGICATTIMKKLFDDLGIANNYYIPSRTKQGYGLSNDIVNTAHDNGFDCLLCVDNGIVANDALSYAKQLGMITYVLDHHEYQDEPMCDYYLHPNLFENKYLDMCASGLCALVSNSIREDEFTTALGGLATLADMVSIFNYNRYIVSEMLRIVKHTRITPIHLLLGRNDVTYTNISFNVIPKINAVSRLDDLMNVNYMVKFLLADEKEAIKYFDKIETINDARKNYSSQMYTTATRFIDDKNKFIVIKHDEFKEGLCGLVANRIMDSYKKPCIIFAQVGDTLKGSGRSVPGFNIYEYLKGCNELFETYGGHELAVGLSLNISNYDKLLEYINTHPIEHDDPSMDCIVIDENKVNFNLLNELDALEPFGTNFKQPLIALHKPSYQSRYVVANKYPKFDINDNLSAISFNSNFINKDFEYMIGKVKKDSYDTNKLSFVIEDLV